MALTPSGFILKAPKCNGPYPYGLLSSIDFVSSSDPHWMASGIQWEDFLCGPPASGFIDVCPPATGYTKPAERSDRFCTADPFLALGSYQCPPVGRDSSEAFEIARQRLLNWEGYQVEQILWTGASANGPVNPSFAFGNPDCDILPENLSPAGPFNPVAAIAVLEEALGDTLACGAVIHVPYGVLAFLAQAHLLVLRDGKYYTPTGFQVIAGHGYPGSGIANAPAPAGTTWIVGTGPIVAVRSNVMMVPESFPESVNRQINNVEVRAERFYSVGYSCVLYFVNVSLSCACC